jgi:hypothetical protein
MIMFSKIVLQLLELQIPVFFHGIEIETNFVEHPFSFLVQFSTSEDSTLIVEPFAQWRVFLAHEWHTVCNSGKRQMESLVGIFQCVIHATFKIFQPSGKCRKYMVPLVLLD